MSKISIDRLAPISFDVPVSVDRSGRDKGKDTGKRRERSKPSPMEQVESGEEEPKHQFDDLA